MVLRTAAALLLIALASAAPAADRGKEYAALGAPAKPKVAAEWNRFRDVAGLNGLLREIAEKHPDLARYEVIGKSFEGRDLVALTVTNFKRGDPKAKPAMWIDGNIHGNEVQAGDVVAYTAWYLAENYAANDLIRDLLDTRVFLLVPSVNPDGRDHWFEEPNNAHSNRGGRIPTDNDGDGLFDEDGPEDIDGDGHITQMRVRDPLGRWRKDSKYPDYLMVRTEEGEPGEYDRVGSEGIDNDGDGQINEDGPGGYDPNRNWPFNWQPNYLQFGAGEYPFSQPETRAVSDFFAKHPNIAGAQAYHNAGGMILRGPGHPTMPLHPEDDGILNQIATRGEAILPGYRNWVVHRDLYQVWGGSIDWYYGMQGVTAFTNEMWMDYNIYKGKGGKDAEGDRGEAFFMRHLLQNQGLTPWKEHSHPQYGTVEIGGERKNFGRVPPSFLLEEELHRNMCFTLYHAEQMPLIAWEDEIRVAPAGKGLWRVRASVANSGSIPTRLAFDVEKNLTPANTVTVSGAKVLAAGIAADRFAPIVAWQEIRPERLEIKAVPGRGRVVVELLLEGSGTATLTATALKGGVAVRKAELR